MKPILFLLLCLTAGAQVLPGLRPHITANDQYHPHWREADSTTMATSTNDELQWSFDNGSNWMPVPPTATNQPGAIYRHWPAPTNGYVYLTSTNPITSTDELLYRYAIGHILETNWTTLWSTRTNQTDTLHQAGTVTSNVFCVVTWKNLTLTNWLETNHLDMVPTRVIEQAVPPVQSYPIIQSNSIQFMPAPYTGVNCGGKP